jgi:hypothetical protein
MDQVGRHLTDQLNLIEGLIMEGRRSMETWGWMFVLWGIGHVGAILWSYLSPESQGLPWLVLMSACGIVTAVACTRAGMRGGKSTVMGRARGAAWAAFCISLALLWTTGIATRQIDFQNPSTLYQPFFALIGGANFTSGITVKLPTQTAVGVLWWVSSFVIMFMPEVTLWALMAMALVGEIAFGLYLMSLERRRETSVPPA